MLQDNPQGILQGIFNLFCSPAPTPSPSSLSSLSPTMIPAFKMDKDGDGKISRKEFDGYLKKINYRLPKNHSEYDEDGDGKFSFDEMVKTTTGRPQGNHSNYEGNPFDIDTDESGTISKKELNIFWNNFGFNFTKKEKRAQMRAYDLDGDGEITEEEFSTALTVRLN